MRKILVKTRFPGNHTRLCEYITALARIHTICCYEYVTALHTRMDNSAVSRVLIPICISIVISILFLLLVPINSEWPPFIQT